MPPTGSCTYTCDSVGCQWAVVNNGCNKCTPPSTCEPVGTIHGGCIGHGNGNGAFVTVEVDQKHKTFTVCITEEWTVSTQEINAETLIITPKGNFTGDKVAMYEVIHEEQRVVVRITNGWKVVVQEIPPPQAKSKPRKKNVSQNDRNAKASGPPSAAKRAHTPT